MSACIIETIPSAEDIRRRIAETYKEARLLKSLLRVAEQREQLTARSNERQEGGDND